MRRSVEEIKSGSETVTGIAEIVAGAVKDQATATGSIADSASRAAARRTQETARTGLASIQRIETDTARIGEAMDELFATAKGARLKFFHPLGKERKAG